MILSSILTVEQGPRSDTKEITMTTAAVASAAHQSADSTIERNKAAARRVLEEIFPANDTAALREDVIRHLGGRIVERDDRALRVGREFRDAVCDAHRHCHWRSGRQPAIGLMPSFW